MHLRGSLQTEEEIPDEGSDAHDWAGQKIILSIEHGVVEFLLTESPDDRPRLKLLEALQALKSAAPLLAGPERGHTAEARKAYEQAGTAADVRRILRKQAEWEEAAALDDDNADLEWLLEVDRLAASRPAGLGARLYEQERRRLAETLEKMRDDDRAGA